MLNNDLSDLLVALLEQRFEEAALAAQKVATQLSYGIEIPVSAVKEAMKAATICVEDAVWANIVAQLQESGVNFRITSHNE